MKAYIVGNFNIIDFGEYMEYAKQSTLITQKYNGKLIIAGQPSSVKEGEPNQVAVVVEFELIETAEKYYNLVGYQEIAKICKKSSSGCLEIISGI